MGAAVDRLIDWMDHVFEHEGWHVSLWDSLRDLSPAQAAWMPAPQRNSIWKIVEHVALWKEDGARRIAGAPPRPDGWDKEMDWRPLPPATEKAWQVTVRRLRDAHARVRAELGKRSDDDLNSPPPGYETPLHTHVRGLVAHDSYHCGQICYLRALQGVPVKVW